MFETPWSRSNVWPRLVWNGLGHAQARRRCWSGLGDMRTGSEMTGPTKQLVGDHIDAHRACRHHRTSKDES
jgi:hypothetical protein